MKRTIQIAFLILLVSGAAEAQHSGGCACGRPNGATETWAIEHGTSVWDAEAKREMAKWNRYTDLFRTTSGDGFAGNNSVNEIAFLTAASTLSAYGVAINSNVFGVTMIFPQWAFGSPSFNACPPPSGTTCGTFTETDVIMNADFSRGWTTALPDFNDSSGPANYHATAVHELGHAIGLHHNFSNFSTMNYFEDFAGYYISLADAQIARLHYPARTTAVSDMGAYPFRFVNVANDGYSSTTIASTTSSSVAAGASLTVRNFMVENVGTTTLSNVKLRFYLSPNRTITTTDYEIGWLSWTSFGPNAYYSPSGSWTFTVPASVPAGTYYLGAQISYSDTVLDGVTYNNSWALESTIAVTAPNDTVAPAISITSPTSATTYTSGSPTINLGGTASDNIGVTGVTWVNDRGGSGTASGTTAWSVAGISLASGANVITVTARDARNNVATDTLTVTYSPPVSDTTPPSLTITSPPATVTVTSATIALSGIASDNVGVASVSWTNSSGGSGTATGTTSWSAVVPLVLGVQTISARSWDAAGNGSIARQVVVTRNNLPAGRADADFNGDGRSDMIWRHSTLGTITMWTMNGRAITSSGAIATVADRNWRLQGYGDFNGDGRADILWRHAISGEVSMWEMNNRTITDGSRLAVVPDSNWRVAAFGDFDGDGRTEIVWRHFTNGAVSMWSVNGHTLLNTSQIGVVADQNWKLLAAVDFNGDGRSEILWRHLVTGDLATWVMDGRTVTSSANFAKVVDTGWVIRAVGDFNGDKKTDLIWRHTNGAVALWQMNGRIIEKSGALPTVSDANWQIERGADLDGDGLSEVIWYHNTSAVVASWRMNGFTVTSTGNIYSLGTVAWRFQPRGGITPTMTGN